MANELDRRNEELTKKLEANKTPRWDKFKHYLRNAAIGTLVAATVASAPLYYLFKDDVTKRQNYPERNVMIRSSNVTKVAGNKEKRAAARADRKSETQFNEGGGGESKVGTKFGSTVRELRGDIEYYNVYNEHNVGIASATLKPEKLQAGMRIGGAFNFREQFAEILLSGKTKDSSKYMVYKFSPERGFFEMDSDVVEYPIEVGLGKDELGIIEQHDSGEKYIRKMYNRLVIERNELGWFYGNDYRTSTFLSDYMKTPKNKALAAKFFEKTKLLDSAKATDVVVREKLVKEIMRIEEQMDKQPIYASREDGFFKILPQDSIVYLGEDPSKIERAMNIIGFGRSDHNILTVLNKWDLFPGRWPLLSGWNWGSGENKMYPFDKFNNGGYTIRDKYGEVAKIKIEDFFWKYGQDVVYHYYLDLDGNGKIDEKTEEITSVLCKTTHDERVELEKLALGLIPDTDITLTVNYSFMSPTTDMKKGWEGFKLGAYLESMLPDVVFRGRGNHSLIGCINDQRSDIMLSKELNIGNLSRALTDESTLVARRDIVRVLNAAKRPYARELACEYGVESDFEGKYTDKPVTSEKMYWGPVQTTAAWGLAGLGAWYAINAMRRRRENAQKKEYESVKANLLGKK